MVVFQSLFLGIVFGLAPVKVAVSPPVVSVDILVDGVTVGTMRGEPWELGCNFGPSPRPQELVAIGRDGEGREVSRARQLINVPKPPIEARLSVNLGTAGHPTTASLIWNIVDGTKPKKVNVFLDGQPVRVKDPSRVELPEVDLARSHFLVGEVVFPRGVVARAEASFGGEAQGSVTTELTAFPVVLRPGATLPPVEAMQGWFQVGEERPRVVAVDEGVHEVIVVFDQDASGRFRGISRTKRGSSILTEGTVIQESKQGNRLSAIWAVPRSVTGEAGTGVRGLFTASITLDLDIDELRSLVFHFPWPAAAPNQQALANAVATAGMQVATHHRRRAVVLIVGEAVPDSSTISVAAARSFLEDLNVPLFVWTPERRISLIELPGWGLPDDVSTDRQLQAGMGRLHKALQAQRIVWLAGSHLPTRITIAPNVRHIFPARGVVRQDR